MYAYRDPNPIVVTNNTPRILSEHGVEFFHYPLAVIDDFYQSYRYWTLTKKPWVTIKIAQSMDGKIAGNQGERVQLSNSLCAEFTHKKRLCSDVILTTTQTINSDNPLFNIRLPAVDTVAKPVAIIGSRTMLNQEAKVFTTAKHCHIYHDKHHPVVVTPPNCTSHGMPAIQGLLDLEAVICHLGQLGYHDVWVEAGGTVFSALHLARLVNRTYIYIVPTVLGESATSAYHHADIFNQRCLVTWQPMGDNMIASLNWKMD